MIFFLDWVSKYWPVIVFVVGTCAALLKLFWRMSSVEKKIRIIEECDNKDMKEVKEALQKNTEITSKINLSVEKLVSYLEGKGVIPERGERSGC